MLLYNMICMSMHVYVKRVMDILGKDLQGQMTSILLEDSAIVIS